jgi:hypothetical protein
VAYKQLNEVERGFAHLKGLLEVRPVYYHKDDRVRAHVFVAALAFLLDRALEKKLRAANSTLSSPTAWQALETVRCLEVAVGGAEETLCHARQPAGQRSLESCRRFRSGSATAAGRQRNPPVVTKLKIRLCVCNVLRGKSANMG